MIYYLYSHIIDWPPLGLQYLQDLDQHMFQHFIPPPPKTMTTAQNLPCPLSWLIQVWFSQMSMTALNMKLTTHTLVLGLASTCMRHLVPNVA